MTKDPLDPSCRPHLKLAPWRSLAGACASCAGAAATPHRPPSSRLLCGLCVAACPHSRRPPNRSRAAIPRPNGAALLSSAQSHVFAAAAVQAAAAVMPVDSPRSIAHRGGTANDAAFGPLESPGCRLRLYVQNAGMNTGCHRRKFCDQGGPGGGDPLFGGSMPSASSFIQNAGVNTEYL